MDLVSELKGDLCIVTNALAKIKEDSDNNNAAGDGVHSATDSLEQLDRTIRDGDKGVWGAGESEHTESDLEKIITAVKGIQSMNEN